MLREHTSRGIRRCVQVWGVVLSAPKGRTANADHRYHGSLDRVLFGRLLCGHDRFRSSRDQKSECPDLVMWLGKARASGAWYRFAALCSYV